MNGRHRAVWAYRGPVLLVPLFSALPVLLTVLSLLMAHDAAERGADPLVLLLCGAYGVVFGVIPAALISTTYARAWARRIRERQRRHEGRCSACGYSLNGNTSGVCPECGRSDLAPVGRPRGAYSRPRN